MQHSCWQEPGRFLTVPTPPCLLGELLAEPRPQCSVPSQLGNTTATIQCQVGVRAVPALLLPGAHGSILLCHSQHTITTDRRSLWRPGARHAALPNMQLSSTGRERFWVVVVELMWVPELLLNCFRLSHVAPHQIPVAGKQGLMRLQQPPGEQGSSSTLWGHMLPKACLSSEGTAQHLKPFLGLWPPARGCEAGRPQIKRGWWRRQALEAARGSWEGAKPGPTKPSLQ